MTQVADSCDCGVCGFEHDPHNAPTRCFVCDAWCYGIADDYEETEHDLAAKEPAS